MRLLWATILALCVLGALVRAASCEPHVARWADPSERAVAYEWSWTPPPPEIPTLWSQPPWETVEGPQTPEPWPHCWTGPIDVPSGWVRVRAVGAGGERSEWSGPRAVPEPPGMLAVGVMALVATVRLARPRSRYVGDVP